MQHQSQDLVKGPTAGKTGLFANAVVVSHDDIERHIAEGKRMQAEAIAGFLAAAFRRLGTAVSRRPAASGDSALPHGA